MNVLQNAEDAEDCVHDVLVRVWKSAHTFAAERGSVRAFLVVCVRNDAISRVRSAARRARLSERVTQETALVDELPLDDFVERGRLREAIAQLPEEQKKAVLLAFFGGKTHVEIARDLAEPLGTVKSRISLGLRKLGNALRGGGEG
jgi:RNA polymerase sigma-70 factor (ECF subfamily)